MKPQIIDLLKSGKVGAMPTDTIYGIIGLALNQKAVEEIYELRKRAADKPLIVLISDLNDLNLFNIRLTKEQKEFLEENWPNPLSVILSCPAEKFKYLHRGTNSLAFRMPKDKRLLNLLKQTGPLVAPSANPEGEEPAETVDKAKEYFGDKASFYVDGGKIEAESSTLIRLKEDGSFEVLRRGAYNYKDLLRTSVL